MALPVQQQMKYWGIVAVLLLAVLWFLGDVMLPFIVGGAVAYLLDPVADRLEAAGLSRVLATATISVAAVLIFVLIILLVVPEIVDQAVQLVQTAPELFTRFKDFISAQLEFLTERFPILADGDSTVRKSLDSLAETFRNRAGELAQTVFASALGVVNVLIFIVVVPVVAFYLLLDWDNMVARIDGLLPRDHAPQIRQIASDIDATLASFVRGQLTVCLILGTYYAIALMIAGLQFGLIVGFIAGLISFIPYIGAIIGGALAVGLAIFQTWPDAANAAAEAGGVNWVYVIVIAAIFQAGQLIEGNVLTPKLVGDSVGLHPVWLLFALSAFGSIFGFVGMLVAVPIAASLGVIARFGVDQYKESRLYRGLQKDD
ncbi:AI-2E family transporter [Litoreibacter roseus]|uniref:AI-2E family transporter n=1 Tax=Litoreibacter roseus TaxID=2601869 RepID=A0A6N6JIN7_9RHOB|nr:AI-2E family transporter [Litoreibacter roseus]GFE65690.1 AI-2E family transporter [Litoreibacter roseus]